LSGSSFKKNAFIVIGAIVIIIGVRYVSNFNTSIDTTLSSADQATTIISDSQPRTITTSSTTLSTSLQIREKQFSIECIGIVIEVIDGDTIEVESTEGFKAGETFTVRLADIDTPERYESGFSTSKSALYERIYGEIIGLDIDNQSIYGTYGRVIAVVYLQIDDSTVMNVNKWLVDTRYARINDFDTNEFNPYTWQLLYDIS